MALGKFLIPEYSGQSMNKNKSTEDQTEDQTEDSINSFTDELKKTFESFENHSEAEALKKNAQQFAKTITEFIQEHPLPTVLGATAVGFLIGFFAGRRK